MSSTTAALQPESIAQATTAESRMQKPPASDTRLLIWMGVAAFALRLAYILFFHTYQMNLVFSSFGLPEGIPHFYFGYEVGSIARSIVTGRGFSSPFGGDTGPTAWLAPVYPYLCAGVFKLFGMFTDVSGLVLLSLNSLFAALNCVFIFKIAEKCFSRAVAIRSGWAWAVLPLFMYWPVRWVWETSLSAILFSAIFLGALKLAERAELRWWVGFGTLWGLTALTNPSLLAFMPFSLAWPSYHLKKDSKEFVRPLLVAVLTCVVVISPWLIRNRIVFHKTLFIRDNFGVEFRLGNFHTSNAIGWPGMHPTKNRRQRNQYIAIGELAYIAERQNEGFAFVRKYPGEFVQLTLQRMVDFWDGRWLQFSLVDQWPYYFYFSFSLLALWGLLLALGNKVRGTMLFACLIFYPAAYYLTYTDPRYRHPIEPVMLILVVFFIYEMVRNFEARWAKT